MNRSVLAPLLPVASAVLATGVTVAGLFAREGGWLRALCSGPALAYMHWNQYDVAGPPETAVFALVVNVGVYTLLFTAIGLTALVLAARRRRMTGDN